MGEGGFFVPWSYKIFSHSSHGSEHMAMTLFSTASGDFSWHLIHEDHKGTEQLLLVSKPPRPVYCWLQWACQSHQSGMRKYPTAEKNKASTLEIFRREPQRSQEHKWDIHMCINHSACPACLTLQGEWEANTNSICCISIISHMSKTMKCVLLTWGWPRSPL